MAYEYEVKNLRPSIYEMPSPEEIQSMRENESNYQEVETMPRYINCDEYETDVETCTNQEIINHIIRNASYPSLSKERGEQGTVFISFIVEKTGSVSKPKVIRSVSPSLDMAAIKVVLSLPNFVPGEHQGKK